MSVTHHAGRTFDRRVHFDPKSRAYPIRAVIGQKVPRAPKVWRPGYVLDQGQDGTCVGHGWEAELLASPVRVKIASASAGHDQALGIYDLARQIDGDAPGSPDGTTVIAGAKAVVQRGYMTEYRWTGVGGESAIDDLIDTLMTAGPVVVGTDWLDGMMTPRPSGLLEVTGSVVGGHCWLVHGYHPGMRIRGEDWKARFEVVRMRQSWGEGWGLGGDALIKVEDMETLLKQDGEGCVPLHRSYGPKAA